MNMANKKGVFEEKLKAYLRGDKQRKGEILDAVIEVSGLTRKGAIKCFRKMQMREALISQNSTVWCKRDFIAPQRRNEKISAH